MEMCVNYKADVLTDEHLHDVRLQVNVATLVSQ